MTTGCQLEWIGVTLWWCQLGAAGQAAWVQAIGSIFAIGVAIFIPYWLRHNEKAEQVLQNRKIVMSAAAGLDAALAYQSAIFAFTPAGDGRIGHDLLTAQEARNFFRLHPRTGEALKLALEKAHYFSEDLCREIVTLSIQAEAYERIVDDVVRTNPNQGANSFFAQIRNTTDRLNEKLASVRGLLQYYLPK